MPRSFEPWVVMMLPPGGFFMIGLLLIGANWRDLRKRTRAQIAQAIAAEAEESAIEAKEREVAVV
jgi:electron transport complex protein RnfE